MFSWVREGAADAEPGLGVDGRGLGGPCGPWRGLPGCCGGQRVEDAKEEEELVVGTGSPSLGDAMFALQNREEARAG